MKFRNGDVVKWDADKWCTAPAHSGTVVGYGTTGMPVLGAMVIISIRPERKLNDTYPYECFLLPEVALEWD